MNGLRGSAAIVGAAESDLGAAPEGTRPVDLMAQAFKLAAIRRAQSPSPKTSTSCGKEDLLSLGLS